MIHPIPAYLVLFLFALSGSACSGKSKPDADVETDPEPDLETVLAFEAGAGDPEPLRGWSGGPPGTLHLEGGIVHGGDAAALLERDARSPRTFSSVTNRLPIDFDGRFVELRGFLRTEDVDGFAGLWLRVDGVGGVLAFDNMGTRGIKGTTGWTEYSIRLPLSRRGRELLFGALLFGEGRTWADDFELLVDDRPVTEAPKRPIEKTVLETDGEFDEGSGIRVSALTERQADHLALLGRVWGFLKYHHPRVAGGELHWDYELFRVLPQMLEAGDGAAANRVLSGWIVRLGVPDHCDPCARLPENAHLLPRLGWIRDLETLGPLLSRQLQAIHQHRFAGDEHFYVSHRPHVGNPVFEHDLSYRDHAPPDAGFRILALMRWWNIIEYWFPYRDQIDGDWYQTLREFLPRIAAAQDGESYRLQLMQLIARAADGHANLWPALDVRPPRGDCSWPASLRFLEGQAVVVATEAAGTGAGLASGDVVEAIDGAPVTRLVDEWAPYYATSNEAARLRDIAHNLSDGDCGDSEAAVRRDGERLDLTVPRIEHSVTNRRDRPGDTFQRLSADIAYLKLSTIRAQDVAGYVEEAAGARGLVIDLRTYPSDFIVFALCARLVSEPTDFARFTRGDLHNPGAFAWSEPVALEPQFPPYRGSVAVLVDEGTQSQAEYTAMACRAGPKAVVVGSTTAGADGNVSHIELPGDNVTTMISGIGVFYPDKTPTQRVGIVPDIVATPTIEGIRAGRDEVLEAALRHLLGPEADEALIREMARRP